MNQKKSTKKQLDHTLNISFNQLSKQDDFRIIWTGTSVHSSEFRIDDEIKMRLSNSVIIERFNMVYDQADNHDKVNKKCAEWLIKYVFPQIEQVNNFETD